MKWLAWPLALIAIAFILHGFPNIHIGSKNYYINEEEDN